MIDAANNGGWCAGRFAYRIDCATGDVACPEYPHYTPGHDEIMSVWDMLCLADVPPRLPGEWAQRGSLSGITSGHDHSALIARFRKAIAKAPERPEEARIALGGSRGGGHGDAREDQQSGAS